MKKVIYKILKKIGIGYLILLCFTQFFYSCLNSKTGQQIIDKKFEGFKLIPQKHEYQVNGRNINYVEVGNDFLPVVVFIHGSPGDWSAWDGFLKDTNLLKKVKLIAVDRAGFGDSDFGNGEKSLKKQALYLQPIVDYYKKKGNKIILIGHSLGGPVICRMAMDYPQLIDRLIIVAGSISPELEPNEKWFRIPFEFMPINVLLPKGIRASNTEILYLKKELELMKPLYKSITQPTIVIQGGKDVLVHPGNADFAKKMIVNASVELVLVPKMNHFVPWSNPELIKNAILKSIL